MPSFAGSPIQTRYLQSIQDSRVALFIHIIVLISVNAMFRIVIFVLLYCSAALSIEKTSLCTVCEHRPIMLHLQVMVSHDYLENFKISPMEKKIAYKNQCH